MSDKSTQGSIAEEVAERATKLLTAIENLLEACDDFESEIGDELLDQLSEEHRTDLLIDAAAASGVLTGIIYNMLLTLSRRATAKQPDGPGA